MNRSTDLAALLLSALDTPLGILAEVSGSSANRRTNAIAALQATKRELLPDHPEMLNIVIKPMPGNPDTIAIRLLPPIQE